MTATAVHPKPFPVATAPKGRQGNLRPRTPRQPRWPRQSRSTPVPIPCFNRSVARPIRSGTPPESPPSLRHTLPAACRRHPMPIGQGSASGSVQHVL